MPALPGGEWNDPANIGPKRVDFSKLPPRKRKGAVHDTDATSSAPRTFGDCTDEELRAMVYDEDATAGQIATAAGVLRKRGVPIAPATLARLRSRAV